MAQTLNRHAHILFKEEDYRFLQKTARSQKKPLGQLIRMAVQKVYGSRDESLRKKAGQRLLSKSDLSVSDWEEMEKDSMDRYG